jgi:hypothetical protein
MSNWEIITPGVVDNSTPVANRWAQSTPATPIKQVRMGIQIPAFNILNTGHGNNLGSLVCSVCIGQMNFSAPQPFTFAPPINLPPIVTTGGGLGCLVIAYLKNNFKTRYILNPLNPLFFPVDYDGIGNAYTGQLILSQFSIEIWQPPLAGLGAVSFAGGVLDSSILAYTTPYSDIIIPDIEPSGGLIQNDLFVGLPLNLPYNWPADTYWNSN